MSIDNSFYGKEYGTLLETIELGALYKIISITDANPGLNYINKNNALGTYSNIDLKLNQSILVVIVLNKILCFDLEYEQHYVVAIKVLYKNKIWFLTLFNEDNFLEHLNFEKC